MDAHVYSIFDVANRNATVAADMTNTCVCHDFTEHAIINVKPERDTAVPRKESSVRESRTGADSRVK